MNAIQSPRYLVLLLLGLICLTLLPSALFAADTALVPLQANYLQEIIGNRSRMIQVSLVCVVFGCALLWWRR